MPDTIEELLGRLLTDVGFRNQVLTAPDELLAGYNLGPAEHAALRALNLSSWNTTTNGDTKGGEDVIGIRRTF